MALLRQVSVYLVGRGASAIASLLSLMVYTRLLEPQEFGRYVLVVSGVGLVNMLLFQWARASLLRFLPMRAYPSEKTLGTLATSIFWLCMGVSALALLLSLLKPEWRLILALGVGLLWTQVWFEQWLEFLRTEQRVGLHIIASNLKAYISLTIGVGLVWFGVQTASAPLLGLIAGTVVATALTGGLSRFYLIGQYDSPLLKEMLRYGIPLTFSLAFSHIIATSDRFLIAWFLGEAPAGLYSASYDFAQQTITMVLSTINLATYPAIIRAYEHETSQAALNQLRRTGTLLLSAGLPLVTLIALLAPNLSPIVFGNEFRETANQVMPWVAVGVLLSGLRAYWFDVPFYLKQNTLTHSSILGLGALSNLVLNVWWIPTFGLMGAVYATLISYALTLILSFWKGRQILVAPIPWADVLKFLLALLGVVQVVWLLHAMEGFFGLVAKFSAGLVTYGTIWALLNFRRVQMLLKRRHTWQR